MAQARGLTGGTTQAESLVSPSRIKRQRLALSFAIAGALSFWLPDVAVHISAGPNFDSRHVWAITILSPAAFLFTYVVARKFAIKQDFRWVGAAMLLGVWITGGVFMTIAAMASGSGFVGVTGVWRLVIIVLSVIPVVTFILARYDGSLFALLVLTLGALLISGVRASRILSTSGPSAARISSEESASQPRPKAA